MGKDLKGKKLGPGLSQRKDKRYSARFVSKSGKRVEKYFKTIQEARNWLEDARYLDKHNTVLPQFDVVAKDILTGDSSPQFFQDETVDQWYTFWSEHIITGLAWNTRRNYRERYIRNIQPVIDKMCIRDVRPMHCRMVLNNMDANYKGSTIKQAYITMGTMFKAAVENDIIQKHPMDGVRYTKPTKAKSKIKFLTIDAQQKFLAAAEHSHNYRQYALILETGLRTGELVGLTWDDIDFQDRTLTVRKTMEYRYSRGIWVAGPPKTISSYRTIPLTNRAYAILKELYDERKSRKQSENLTLLSYVDRISNEERPLDMKNLVFLNFRTGMPTKNSSYDTHLYKLCHEAGIERFCMHALRHTYATRAVERGVDYKTLQQLLGHASLQTTMDTCVHVTNESMRIAVETFERNGVGMA